MLGTRGSTGGAFASALGESRFSLGWGSGDPFPEHPSR